MIGEYIVTIASAAIVTGILTVFLDRRGTAGAMGKVFCGVFLAVTILNPVQNFSFDALEDWLEKGSIEASAIAAEGIERSNDSLQSVIKDNCETYIQDKGTAMGLKIRAEVTLAADAPFAPVSVRISGTAAPYKKAVLESIITADLDIQKERIIWN